MFLSLLDLLRQQSPAGLPLDRSYTPPISWREEEEHLVLEVDLRGIDPRSVRVQLTETSLGLAGRRTQEQRVEGPGYVRSSAFYSAFHRTFPLPVRVVPRLSDAKWLDGERLRIRLRRA